MPTLAQFALYRWADVGIRPYDKNQRPLSFRAMPQHGVGIPQGNREFQGIATVLSHLAMTYFLRHIFIIRRIGFLEEGLPCPRILCRCPTHCN